MRDGRVTGGRQRALVQRVIGVGHFPKIKPIEREGTYTFFIMSDDGSRLLIDDNLVNSYRGEPRKPPPDRRIEQT